MQTPPASVSTDPWAAAVEWPWYVTRLVKGGPEIACELWVTDGARDAQTGALLSDQKLIATINGEQMDISDRWPPGWPWRAVQCRRAPQPVSDPTRRRDIRTAPMPF